MDGQGVTPQGDDITGDEFAPSPGFDLLVDLDLTILDEYLGFSSATDKVFELKELIQFDLFCRLLTGGFLRIVRGRFWGGFWGGLAHGNG